VPQVARHRRLDHAEHGLAIFDEGDVDGEFAVALDELARAVERIDQPQAPPIAAHEAGHVLDRFLRQHRHVRREALERVDDAAVRGEVGRRQRRLVVLVLHRELAVVDSEDVCRRVACDRDDRLAQRVHVRHCHAATTPV